MKAIFSQNIQIVSAILKSGSSINVKDANGVTPLEYCQSSLFLKYLTIIFSILTHIFQIRVRFARYNQD